MGNVLYVRGVLTRREGTQKVSLRDQVQCVVASGVVLETPPFYLAQEMVFVAQVWQICQHARRTHTGGRDSVRRSRDPGFMWSANPFVFLFCKECNFFGGWFFPGTETKAPF